MIGEALKLLLVASPALTAIIGDRVFPTVVPQGAGGPALFYDDEGVKPLPCRVPDGSFRGTIEVGILAEQYDGVHAGLKALRLVLDNYSGQVGDFSLSFDWGESTKPDYNDELGMHMQSLQYTVSGQQLTI